jgi:two-component system invasion response regulator UvrY
MKKITILIAEDHMLVRQTWHAFLNSDERFEVVADCASGEEAVQLASKLRPDVILMDINLPGINGIEATRLIRKYTPGSKILGVSLHTQPAYARKMIQEGATGYITKNSSGDEMVKAIIEVNSHRKYICNEIKDIMSEQMMNGDNAGKGLESLSRREIDIIALIKQGLSSKEIADKISISVKTVEVHRYNILKKLGLKNVAAMVNFINNSQLAIGAVA